jgi:hypothetical protein
MKRAIVLFALIPFIAAGFGCSSTTMIRSSDPAAKIYVDGEYEGQGIASHTDTKIVGSTTLVTLKKEGCQPQTFSFSRSEEIDIGACIGGVFVLVPFLWIEKYRPEHNFEFECEKISTSSGASLPVLPAQAAQG